MCSSLKSKAALNGTAIGNKSAMKEIASGKRANVKVPKSIPFRKRKADAAEYLPVETP